MGLESKNYEAIKLASGSTYDLSVLGNGMSANSVHNIYCLSAGELYITAMGGGSFNWSATTNTSIDIVPSFVAVSGGTFVAFRTKNQGMSYTSNILNG
jgi:hypothetical protein